MVKHQISGKFVKWGPSLCMRSSTQVDGHDEASHNFENAANILVLHYLLIIYLLHGTESRNSPHFTEPEGSLPHSQASATCLYPGPAQSSSHTHIPPPGDPA